MHDAVSKGHGRLGSESDQLQLEILGRLEIAGKVNFYLSGYTGRATPIPANTPDVGRSEESSEKRRQLLDQYTKEAVAAMGVDPSRSQITTHGARIAAKLQGTVSCGKSLIKEIYQGLQKAKMVSHDGKQRSATALSIGEAMSMQQLTNLKSPEGNMERAIKAIDQARMMFLRVGEHRSATTPLVGEVMSMQQADNLESPEKPRQHIERAVEQAKMVPQRVGEHHSAATSPVGEATSIRQTGNTESPEKPKAATSPVGEATSIQQTGNIESSQKPRQHSATTSPVDEAASNQQKGNIDPPENPTQRMERTVEQAVEAMDPLLLSARRFEKYKMKVCRQLRRDIGLKNYDLFRQRVNERLDEARRASLDRLGVATVGRDRRRRDHRRALQGYAKSTGVMTYCEMSVSFARNVPLNVSVLPITPEGLLQEGGLWRKLDNGDQFLSRDNVVQHHEVVALREAVDRHLDGNAAKGYPVFWVDGSVSGDYTVGGSAVVFCSDYSGSDSEKKSERWIHKGFTIPVLISTDSAWSELLAIAKAVEIAYTLPRPQEPDQRVVSIYTDSMNVLEYLTGNGIPMNDGLQKVVSQVVQGIKDFESQAGVQVVLRWIPSHALIPGHAVADVIASRTMKVALGENDRASGTEEQQGTKQQWTTTKQQGTKHQGSTAEGASAPLAGINGRLENLERVFQEMEAEKTALQTRASQLETENRMLKDLVLKNKSTGDGQEEKGFAARLKALFFGR